MKYSDWRYEMQLHEKAPISGGKKGGGLKLPKPNVLGEFQIENISTAIATIRNLKLQVDDIHIKNGITKIKSIARLQEIKKGKIKDLSKNNRIFVDGSHNPLGAKALNKYLETLNCNKHVIIGMMSNNCLLYTSDAADE